MRALYVLVFGSGAVLMALEVLGSRLIAPFFGSSIYVWGSLISVFLTALSVGYYLGGTLADKWPAQSTLTYLLAGSGALTALIPTMAEPVASAFTALGARAGALAAATVIFLPATLVMGMVSPVAVRLGVADLANLGKAAGRLSAVSTAGSIAGTLVTTFFLVPLTGTKLLITGLAGVLFGLAALSYVRDRKYTMATAAAAWALFLVVFGPHGALTGTTEYVPGLGLLRTIYATESAYHDIRVMDGNDQRYLRFNNSWQTGMSLSDPYESPIAYTDYFHLPVARNPKIREVLVIGLGGGTAPKRFWRDYPQVHVDVVELDPKVVEVARTYFELPQDKRLNVVVDDGRRFLETTPKRYDLIILDAYHSDSIPFHLATREFLSLVRQRLTPDGQVAMNIIGALEGGGSQFFRSMYRTAGDVFPSLSVFPVDWVGHETPSEQRNIVLLATAGAATSREEWKALAAGAGSTVTIRDFSRFGQEFYGAPIKTGDVPVLTDDHAPVDNMIKVLD